jgi:hypothetical protein
MGNVYCHYIAELMQDLIGALDTGVDLQYNT